MFCHRLAISILVVVVGLFLGSCQDTAPEEVSQEELELVCPHVDATLESLGKQDVDGAEEGILGLRRALDVVEHRELRDDLKSAVDDGEDFLEKSGKPVVERLDEIGALTMSLRPLNETCVLGGRAPGGHEAGTRTRTVRSSRSVPGACDHGPLDTRKPKAHPASQAPLGCP